MTDPRLARPTWRSRTNVDAITIAAIEKAERLAGKTFIVTQGSYQGGDGERLSAGTHDRGGAVDLRWTGDDGDILALRKAGFAAWHRTPAQGPWPDHIHAVLVDHPLLADSAAKQVASYRRGRNGLKGDGSDDGPRLSPIPVFTWPPEDDMANYADQLDRIEAKIDRAAKRDRGRWERTVTILRRLRAEVKDTATLAEIDDLLKDAG